MTLMILNFLGRKTNVPRYPNFDQLDPGQANVCPRGSTRRYCAIHYTIRRNLFTIRSCGTMRYEEFIKRLTKLMDSYDNDPWAKAEINGVCNLIYDIRNILEEYKIK